MNLRKAENYDIGLDLGTGSVGWAVASESGELYKFNGKTTWGSRLFPSAESAEAARLNRGQRRRYVRRRQRLDLLQGFFFPEMKKKDSDFFVRLNQSRLLPEDRDSSHWDYRWPLFNGSDFTEVDYYKQFPTIYHLRAWLMQTDEKADIRLIYLAFHNIIKHRGNFLHQDNSKLSAKTADTSESVNKLCRALSDWCENKDITCKPESKQIKAVLNDNKLSNRAKQEALMPLFGLKDEKRMSKALSYALIGYVADFSQILLNGYEDGKFKLSNEEKVDEFLASCLDEDLEFFEAIQAVYSSFVLLGILSGATGETISFCKIKEYERYAKDLATLKQLIKDYRPKEYSRFFRGVKYEGTALYDAVKAEGYTKYNLGNSKLTYEDFTKEILKVLKGSGAEADMAFQEMHASIEDGVFLRRLKTSDNGSIPYQLHLEEMQAIIENQAQHYPFLQEHRGKIESLVTFRIPYYVGPLTQKNAATDTKGNNRFAWSKRLPGKESETIYPWNWDHIIDKDTSAEDFIRRMTGTCTYLQGEPVLPRCSLMYELFCVLNELNGARYVRDGEKKVRFDAGDRIDIVDELFKRRKTVSYKIVEEWLKKKHGPGFAFSHVSGGQGETGFESKLSSYNDFCKILSVDRLDESDIPMIEEIVLWNTLFEDRDILRRRIAGKYGSCLSREQIKAICKKRYTGWGRLSKTLLDGLKAQTNDGPKSIMDILVDGNPNSGQPRNKAMNLMEILHDDLLGFSQMIDEFNAKKLNADEGFTLVELPGSPALRRSINQAMRIVREIAGIAGKPPANIFIEVTREEDEANKGRRTRRRYDRLKEALVAFKKEDPDIYRELGEYSHAQLDERLTLYFMQRGKSMYSGKDLDISRLSEYQIDHIIPQSYVKDDSFENKVLVLSDENQRKMDSLLLDPSIINRMKHFWQSLLDAGLIGEKKFNSLMRARISDDQLKGFINRQLVETSQIVKRVQQIMQSMYPNTNVLPIKAGFSSQLRNERGLVKCREINDYHHAHDAYLASQIGRFIQYRHGYVFENPLKMAAVVKKFIKKQGEDFSKTRRMPGSAGFIVSSFLTSGFDKDTGEIFKDQWDADAEIARIRKCLNFKDCFISRMPEETSGAFWDATIYSPRDSKKALGLPLKQGLDPQKYGSYSREQFAYFFVYEGFNVKKGSPELRFEAVPVSLAAAIENDPSALERYAASLAQEAGLKYQQIRRKKILKQQQIIMDNDRFYITGKEEVRNARQFAFSQKETELICRILNDKDVASSEIGSLLLSLQNKFNLYAPRLEKLLKVATIDGVFGQLTLDEQKSVILSLLHIAAAKKNAIDMRPVGGSQNSGRIITKFSKGLSDQNTVFLFIDQSVTGMFERRQSLGL